MKSLKNIVSFIIPLSVMLITFSMYMFTEEVINNYKEQISKDYSIVVVAKTPLINDDVKVLDGIKVKEVLSLSKDEMIKKVKDDLSKDSLFLLKQRLPYFYKIYLEEFPTSFQLDKIKEQLLALPNIKKVEVFSKNHNQVFSLLVLNQKIIALFFIISLLYSTIMFSKQIQIWFYEHQEKISIMQLHGASIIYSASAIIRDALISAFISFLIVSGIIIFIFKNLTLVFPAELEAIISIEATINKELFFLFLLSMIISITTIIGVLFKYKLKK